MTTTQIQPRLKVHLLQGKRISTLEGLHMYGTMHIAEFVRLLRNKGYNIVTEMKKDPKTGKRYGVYYIPKTTKKCRI